jgi:hypothetical protein
MTELTGEAVNELDKYALTLGMSARELPPVTIAPQLATRTDLLKAIRSSSYVTYFSSSSTVKHFSEECALKKVRTRALFNAAATLHDRVEELCRHCYATSTSPLVTKVKAWKAIHAALSSISNTDRAAELCKSVPTDRNTSRLVRSVSELRASMNIGGEEPNVQEWITRSANESLRQADNILATFTGKDGLTDMQRRSVNIAAATCITRKGVNHGRETPPVFKLSTGENLAWEAAELAINVRYTAKPKYTTLNIEEFLREKFAQHKLAGPRLWSHIPLTLTPRKDNETVAQWMLASWENEFDRETEHFISTFMSRITQTLKKDTMRVNLTVPKDLANHMSGVIFRELSESFGASFDAGYGTYHAKVPLTVAGIVALLASEANETKQCSFIAEHSEDQELLDTALTLLSSDPTSDLTLLPNCVELARELLAN